MRHKRAARLRFLAFIAFVAVAMVADSGPHRVPLTPPDVVSSDGVIISPTPPLPNSPEIQDSSTLRENLTVADHIADAGKMVHIDPPYPVFLDYDQDGATVHAAGERVRALGGVLNEDEMRALLAVAGWEGRDLEEALRVSFGESRWSPYALGDSGRSLGLFQLNGDTWSRYCGIPRESLYDALENAKCARQVFLYEQARYYPRWANWSVKP